MLAVRHEACCAQWCSRIAQFRLHDLRGWPVIVAFGLMVIRPGTQLTDERKANCARQFVCLLCAMRPAVRNGAVVSRNFAFMTPGAGRSTSPSGCW